TLPQQWYLDFFALNRFDFAQTYFLVYDGVGFSAYEVNLAKRAASRTLLLNFPTMDQATPIALVTYAVKGRDSTWDRSPSQECYRADAEWREMEPFFTRFAAGELAEPLMRSSVTSPITLPGGDDFRYIDVDGGRIVQSNREQHDARLR